MKTREELLAYQKGYNAGKNVDARAQQSLVEYGTTKNDENIALRDLIKRMVPYLGHTGECEGSEWASAEFADKCCSCGLAAIRAEAEEKRWTRARRKS